MFAVFKTGGKQYKASPGDILRVEKLAAAAGEKIQFNEILMVDSAVGTPTIADAAVQAEVIDQIKADKVISFVKRRRKHSSKRTRGHRQQLTLIKVTDILEKGASTSGVKAAVGGSLPASEVVADKPKGKAAPKAKAAPASEAPAKPAAKDAPPKKAEAKTADTKSDQSSGDLKQLTGVGPALEKKLIGAGIKDLAQIAALDADGVAQLDETLALKGRIDRDGWVEQAKTLTKS